MVRITSVQKEKGTMNNLRPEVPSKMVTLAREIVQFNELFHASLYKLMSVVNKCEKEHNDQCRKDPVYFKSFPDFHCFLKKFAPEFNYLEYIRYKEILNSDKGYSLLKINNDTLNKVERFFHLIATDPRMTEQEKTIVRHSTIEKVKSNLDENGNCDQKKFKKIKEEAMQEASNKTGSKLPSGRKSKEPVSMEMKRRVRHLAESEPRFTEKQLQELSKNELICLAIELQKALKRAEKREN